LDADSPLLSGLPGDLQQLIAATPVTDKQLLELTLDWADLPSVHAEVAALLRVFLITWDPLEHAPVPVARTTGWATLNIEHSDVEPDDSRGELVVYLPVWAAADEAARTGSTFASVIATVAGNAVTTVAINHLLAAVPGAGQVQVERQDLTAAPSEGLPPGTPQIRAVSPGWQDIGLGAITDIVQHAFGPVDLDRSAVELAPARSPRPGCPACAGHRFGFPGELADSRDQMCLPHRDQAQKVIRARLARANASNPDGWAALGEATIRRELPHLPNGLATKLAPAADRVPRVDQPDELAERARLVVEAANWFPARLQEFVIALGEDPELATVVPDWVVSLILDLGRAGLGEQAARVGDALTSVDPQRQAFYADAVAVALARAGMADQARARVAENLALWPDDVWVRVHAGDALAALDDLDAATAHFEAARDLASSLRDTDARFIVERRLRDALRAAGGSPPPPVQQRHQPRRHPPRRKRKR
jgi:hypothetical protein